MKTLAQLTVIPLAMLMMVATESLNAQSAIDTTDRYLWLEERTADSALDWVKKHDSATLGELRADPNFATFQAEALAVMNAKDRIPAGSLMGGYVYNFWQDADHVRGLYRRATLDEYAKPNPKWETILDIDSINKAEGKSWVFKGANLFPPEYQRALVTLSDGGKDAAYVREFDLTSRTFVVDGFSLPEAKSSVAWYDRNTVLVGTDFGPNSLTSSGYPRIVKMWHRGTSLSDARTILEGENSDVSVHGSVDFRPEGNVFRLSRGPSFWESISWIVGADSQRTEIPLPKDAAIHAFFKGYLIATLYSDWLGFSEGSIISVKMADLKSSDLASKVELLYKPDDKSTVTGVASTKDYLLVSILRNVKGRILHLGLQESSGLSMWTTGELNLPEYGTLSVVSADDYSNAFMVSFEDFLTPSKLYFMDGPSAAPREIKSRTAMFEAKDLVISQGEARSVDGVMIPYFMVSRKDIRQDGKNPTLLYGYGGFRSAMTPFYSGTVGKLWLERGGVFVIANIRGGDEFGPRWHKAALLKNRQKCFDDFIAVAQDLISRKITSPRHLGIEGGSNGGLLVGATFTQRPDLFNAVVCQVPLLDMLRYTKLPPGASWIGEYGDPDSADMRAYIATYSPYQNIKAGVKYPKVLFVTSTRDDRVHPGHARKTAAKMEGLGNRIYYFEETEGGHAASADNVQRAKRVAMEYTYLWKMLAR
ncbi:MAG: S9 family peptidase [candidate division Zixibacteria bacterium]|nr:S9 family peptidase [candidate division Zixibacteria bacterium]